MAIKDKTIDPKILISAKKEFLTQGFEKASIRKICRNAQVTTGAFYTRYKNKDELFSAVVADTLEAIEMMYTRDESPTFSQNQEGEVEIGWLLTVDAITEIVNFIYDNYDGMRLLLCYSSGSSYENFLHIFTNKSTKLLLDYFNNVKDLNFSLAVDEEELHIILTAFWASMFEPVIHGFSYEKALSYSRVLAKFFNFEAIVNIY